MPRYRSEIINPESLSPRAREQLTDELYATHAQIFTGVSRDDFAKYVIHPAAERTRIEVYRERGRVVGYFAMHTFVRVIEGERWVVLRAEVGKLPESRRGARPWMMVRESARICLRYPSARKAYLGCYIHPSAYVATSRMAPEFYPHWQRPTPEPMRKVMRELAGAFGLERASPACSGVRRVGWITRESDNARSSWRQRDCDISRFFIRENPGYVRGDGLVVLIPIHVRNFFTGMFCLLERAVSRARVRRQAGAALRSSSNS